MYFIHKILCEICS